MIPYLTAGGAYGERSDNLNSYNLNLGGGMAIRNGHLAILLEGGFRYEHQWARDFRGDFNSLYLSVGLAGFLYKSQEG